LGLIEKVEAIEFLGQEFLTWMCWHSERENGKMKLAGMDEFELYFEAPVRLVADYGEATVVTLLGGTPMDSPESRQALKEGKKLDRTRLRLIHRNQTYTFGFNAANFAISGLKLPLPPNVSPADFIFVRLEILEEFEKFMSTLFDAFLSIRLEDKKWDEERRKLAKWVKSFERT
jgi:hypothetical protein